MARSRRIDTRPPASWPTTSAGYSKTARSSPAALRYWDEPCKFSRRYRAAVRAVGVSLLLTTVLATLAAVQFGRMASREHELREQEARVRGELESQLYFHHIDLADCHWKANDVRMIGPLLEQCPTRLRGWEWFYLKGLRRAPECVITSTT